MASISQGPMFSDLLLTQRSRGEERHGNQEDNPHKHCPARAVMQRGVGILESDDHALVPCLIEIEEMAPAFALPKSTRRH